MENLVFCAVGVNKSRRVTDIKAVRENFVTSINVCNSKDKLFLASIIGFHSFTEVTLSVPFLAGVRQNL